MVAVVVVVVFVVLVAITDKSSTGMMMDGSPEQKSKFTDDAQQQQDPDNNNNSRTHRYHRSSVRFEPVRVDDDSKVLRYAAFFASNNTALSVADWIRLTTSDGDDSSDLSRNLTEILRVSTYGIVSYYIVRIEYDMLFDL